MCLIKPLLDHEIKTGFHLQTPCRLWRQLVSKLDLCFVNSFETILDSIYKDYWHQAEKHEAFKFRSDAVSILYCEECSCDNKCLTPYLFYDMDDASGMKENAPLAFLFKRGTC